MPEDRRKWIWLVVAGLVGLALGFGLPFPFGQRIVAAVLVAAMVLWISEALPLGITALAAAVALVVLGGFGPRAVFASYFDPVVVLLFGGFLLGVALRRHGLDHALADTVLRRAGVRPPIVLLAVMALTATFSMWVSNTATTAIMLPIAVALAAGGSVSRGRGFVLGVAAAANIGGIGTPMGTPANALALRFLDDAGTPLTILGWMGRAVPLVIVMVVAAWWVVGRMHPLGSQAIAPSERRQAFTPAHGRLMALFTVTVALWLSSDWHGLDAGVVSAAAAVGLFSLRLIDEDDLRRVNWDTLLLIGGSIALGHAIQDVGLDARLAAPMRFLGGQGPTLALAGLALVAIALTLVSSNTAAAVILVPLAILWSASWGLSPVVVAMTAAVAVSFDFLVPMGTPPNAMARATGLVDLRAMLRSGIVITLLGAVAVVLLARWFW